MAKLKGFILPLVASVSFADSVLAGSSPGHGIVRYEGLSPEERAQHEREVQEALDSEIQSAMKDAVFYDDLYYSAVVVEEVVSDVVGSIPLGTLYYDVGKMTGYALHYAATGDEDSLESWFETSEEFVDYVTFEAPLSVTVEVFLGAPGSIALDLFMPEDALSPEYTD